MRSLVLILMVLISTSANAGIMAWFGGYFAKSDAPKPVIDAKLTAQQDLEREVLAIRDTYLESRSVNPAVILESLKSFYKVCDFGKLNSKSSNYRLTPVSPEALPFWREITSLALARSASVSCRESLIYTLQPAVWSEEVWSQLRDKIKTEQSRTNPASVPNWAQVLLIIAARPDPEMNPVPQDIQHASEQFLERISHIGSDMDQILLQLDQIAERSQAANRAIEDYKEEAQRYNKRLMSPEAINQQIAALKLGNAPRAQHLKSTLDSRSINVVSHIRGIGLVLEALRPGALMDSHPELAKKILYPEDIFGIQEGRSMRACESNLK